MKLNLLTLSILFTLPIAFASSPANAAETVWISSLDLTPILQGWGKPLADKSVTGKPLSIAGKTFERGLGTHADSLIRLDLKGGSERFSASVGIDDATAKDTARLVFKVVGDGKTLWKSAVMKLGQPAESVDLDVKGIKTLLLKADVSGTSVAYAHADWADAKLLVTGERPAITDPPPEPAVILTPKPPRTPRINGPRIFGVRAGHPFLYTISAHGGYPAPTKPRHRSQPLPIRYGQRLGMGQTSRRP